MKVAVFTILSVLYIFSLPMSRAAGPPGDESAEQTELSVTYQSDAMAQKKFEWLSHTWLAGVTLKLVGPWELGKIDAYRLYITFPPNQEEGGRVKALGFSFNDMAGITISVNDTQGYFIEDKDHACRLHYRGYKDEKWYEQQVETEDALRKQIVGMIAGEVVGRFDYPFQLYEAWKGGKTNTPVFEASTLNFKFDNSTGDHNEPSSEFSDDATFDFKRVTWQKLCYRGDRDGGYAAGFGHIVAYSFHMHRATDAVPFHIRVVLPYDVPAAGYESTMSKRYPVRYVELEWRISGSAAEFTETTFGSNTYRLYSSPKMSWLDAKVDCQSRGGHLVTIDSKEENKAMADLLESAGEQNAWIGWAVISDPGSGSTSRG